MGRQQQTKKKVSSNRVYKKATLKDKIKLAVTGADPYSNAVARGEEKLREKIKKVASHVGNKLGVPKRLKQVIGKAVKGGAVVTSATRLASKLMSPSLLPQLAAKKFLKLGLTLPGSKYIGPGNPLNLGAPVTSADAAAYRHDKAYDHYIQSGIPASDVYTKFSKADEQLMKESDITTVHGLATYGGMGLKKMFLGRLKE